MIEVIDGFLGMIASFINRIFLFQIEWEAGQMLPIGKIVVAFSFVATSFYLIFDSFGLIGGGE